MVGPASGPFAWMLKMGRRRFRGAWCQVWIFEGVCKPLNDVDHLFLEVLGEVLAYRLEEDEKSLVAPTLTALNTSPLP
jgi:hypothetical protein